MKDRGIIYLLRDIKGDNAKHMSTRKQVAIVTHEDFIGNTVETLLTQIFHDLELDFEIASVCNNLRGNDVRLTVMSTPYSKQLVNNVAKLKGLEADLLVILCHGVQIAGQTGLPSALCFATDEMDLIPASLMLRACEKRVDPKTGALTNLPGYCTTLRSVTNVSRLAIVLCCHGDHILREFKSTNPTSFTDMLVCNRTDIDNRSYCLFFVMLCKLIDGDEQVRASRKPEMHVAVKDHIRTIFADVKKFGENKDTFWKFLCDRHFVSENGSTFRVVGVLYSFKLVNDVEDFKETILQDFQALTLVCWDENTATIVEETWSTGPLLPGTLIKKRLRDTGLAALLESLRLVSTA